jgi:hypothetical protein
MSKLIGELVGQHKGPVLVIGAAPCLPKDLAALRAGGFDFDKAVIVSGNEHAVYAGLKPRYIVSNDDVHTVLKVHQEPRLRQIAPYAKLCTRHWWGDYRSHKMIKANSGITALLWGSLMGGNPTIAAGFELYRGAGCYFHSKAAHTSPSMSRPDQFMLAQVVELRERLGGAPLRAVSGPLAHEFGLWRPEEVFQPRAHTDLEYQLMAEALDSRVLCAITDASNWQNAVVPQGMTFAATAKEAMDLHIESAFIDVTGKDLDGALAARREYIMREHERLLAMIAKARNSRQSVRRGIYGQDLMRIVRMREAGNTLAVIAKAVGFPEGQIKTLLKLMGVTDEAGKNVGRDSAPVQQPLHGDAPDHGQGRTLLLEAPPLA